MSDLARVDVLGWGLELPGWMSHDAGGCHRMGAGIAWVERSGVGLDISRVDRIEDGHDDGV